MPKRARENSSGGIPHVAAPSRSGGAPCDTMYIGNLAVTVTEAELNGVLYSFDGFERAKFIGIGTDKAMAFALFDSAQSCEAAIHALHGNALPSSPYTALVCQYSKNSL